MSIPFLLDPRLEQDSLKIIDLTLSECRLINNKNFLWVILIPKKNNLRELIDLDWEDQVALLQEINELSQVLLNLPEINTEKINIATLGNLVSQLHIHVIARNTQDIAWPNPVWGKPILKYTEVEAEKIISSIKTSLEKF